MLDAHVCVPLHVNSLLFFLLFFIDTFVVFFSLLLLLPLPLVMCVLNEKTTDLNHDQWPESMTALSFRDRSFIMRLAPKSTNRSTHSILNMSM